MKNWTLKTFQVKDLKDYHKNPRRLSAEQFEHLKTSLEKFGLIDKPICTEEGQLIGGHQRKKILQRLGIKEVECWVPDSPLDDKQIEELVIRLNKNTGDWDFDILANRWMEEDLMAWGFSADEIPTIDTDILTEDEPEKPKKDKLCPHCGLEL